MTARSRPTPTRVCIGGDCSRLMMAAVANFVVHSTVGRGTLMASLSRFPLNGISHKPLSATCRYLKLRWVVGLVLCSLTQTPTVNRWTNFWARKFNSTLHAGILTIVIWLRMCHALFVVIGRLPMRLLPKAIMSMPLTLRLSPTPAILRARLIFGVIRPGNCRPKVFPAQC